MADFYSSIKNLNDKLNKFIKEYESLDDMDPLTMNLLKSFKKKIAHFNTSSLEYTNHSNNKNLRNSSSGH